MNPHASQLPLPDKYALAQSNALKAIIIQAIEQHQGKISFSQFMQMCLYQPGLGYYVAGSHKFGEGGDFVTAPELTPLFSHCLAEQCAQVIREMNHSADILEFGAGRGVMAADVLLSLEQLKCLPKNYFILELSPELRQRQQQTLKTKAPHLYDCVTWIESLPDDESFKGIILANEVLDAMPVERVRIYRHGEFKQLMVALDADQFVYVEQDLKNVDIKKHMQSIFHLVEDMESEFIDVEINTSLQPWLQSVYQILHRGLVLLIDYGYPDYEYFHPQRRRGTLACHYQHRVHDDAFVYVGLQDITAHVDFSDLAQRAENIGFDLLGYTSQAHFLTACGIEEKLQNLDQSDVKRFLSLVQPVKRLLMPQDMGEQFKVIALGKQLKQELVGFSLINQSGKLKSF
ncbi:MAG: SAM-dependent methyltransferase [Gammaproteobacteria bacterium]|nr:SAM-dependent methyltransferase [Gammaproteobacteria bacterium]